MIDADRSSGPVPEPMHGAEIGRRMRCVSSNSRRDRMASLPLTGHCLCGGVRYEITKPLVTATYCHCTRCQRRTGTAAAVSARIAPGSLRILSGQDLIKAWRPPDGFAKLFCSNCGSALWSQSPTDPEIISVRMGTFDG